MPTEEIVVTADLRDAGPPGRDSASVDGPFDGDWATGPFTMRDGTVVTIRPILARDEPAMVRFHASLSDESVYHRYFHPLKLGHRIAHERLARICHVDPAREMVLIVERTGPPEPDIIAVGRLTRTLGARQAEFAIVVSDAAQGLGLGTEMLERLVAVGRRAGLARITAEILPDNLAMQAVARRVGFSCAFAGGEGLVHAEHALEAARTRT